MQCFPVQSTKVKRAAFFLQGTALEHGKTHKNPTRTHLLIKNALKLITANQKKETGNFGGEKKGMGEFTQQKTHQNTQKMHPKHTCRNTSKTDLDCVSVV